MTTYITTHHINRIAPGTIETISVSHLLAWVLQFTWTPLEVYYFCTYRRTHTYYGHYYASSVDNCRPWHWPSSPAIATHVFVRLICWLQSCTSLWLEKKPSNLATAIGCLSTVQCDTLEKSEPADITARLMGECEPDVTPQLQSFPRAPL